MRNRLTEQPKEVLEERLAEILDQMDDTELPIHKYYDLLHEKELLETKLKEI